MEEVSLRRTLDEDEEDEEEEDDDEDDIDGENGGRKNSAQMKRKWDSFRDIPTKQESGSQASQDWIDYSVRIQKLLAYLITFLVVLVGGVVSKAGLLLVTSQIYPTQNETCYDEEFNIRPTLSPLIEERVLWTWTLFFIICLPDIGTFIRAARFCFFKNQTKPLWRRDFLVVLSMETLYAVGTSLLVFQVLPNIDVIRGVMLTNALSFIPSILRLLSLQTSTSVSIDKYVWAKQGADLLAVLFQFSALIVWPLTEMDARYGWIAPALLFTSCGWWLNYVPDVEPEGPGFLTKIRSWLFHVKKGTRESLYWTYLIVSVWKIMLYFSVMLIIIAIQGDLTVQEFFDYTPDAFYVHYFNESLTKMISSNTLAVYEERIVFSNGQLDWLYVAIVVSAGSYCCYVFSKFASKIMIQEVGMALPNLLVVPCTVGLLVIFDQYQSRDNCFSQRFLPHYLFWNTELTENYVTDKVAWIWLLWLVSQGWITFHVWFPQNERLASTEKLLTTPMYSAIAVDQSICMNRVIEDIQEVENSAELGEDSVPNVIACATMWHESMDEMLEMFKSILRMDLDQCAHKNAKSTLKNAQARNNFYNFETQIFFDDAFTLEADGSSLYVINSFVKDMIKCLPKAVREVYRSNKIKLDPPEMFPTPYGGRLVYKLPGETVMTVHLKDKNKIRHRKRWSQCMYMYYLLGFNLMDIDMPASRKETRAKNTFLLALDGDIDFQPKAVRLLVDLMKKNDKLGAACGRIHPVGSGLMAWYQIFEYAIGHWLQKATEHMIGCVLCSPGCFSLFRGFALMDDNVMKTYTKDCQAARHYVQYDQGEDRWLCTLLLQRGYRVEYSAASDAYTHCPEDFNEFYNQRRRWVPSTMANILDLLGSYKRTIEVNPNISFPYIMYQTMLLGGTILGPGTIFLMLVGAFVAAFKIDNWTSFYWNLIPIIAFIGICLFTKANIQLMFALVVSTVYGLIMMAVLVGILIQIQEDGPFAPSTLFLFIVAGEIIVAGLMHPQEVYCLPSGAIYYVTIPSMYLLLIIYSVCNLNVVSWGTREVAAKKTKEEIEEEKRNAHLQAAAKNKGSSNAIFAFLESFAPNKKEKGSIDFSFAGLFRCMLCTSPQSNDEMEHLIKISDTLSGFTKKLENIERSIQDPSPSVGPSRRRTTISRHASNLDLTSGESIKEDDLASESEEEAVEVPDDRNELINPYWIEDPDLGKAKTKFLTTKETKFWDELIARYLKPIDEDKAKQKKIAEDLKELRNKTVITFFMLNALFVTIVFLLQLNKDTIYVDWPIGAQSNITFNADTFEILIDQRYLKLEPIGLVFVIFFAIILLIQFTGMFLHRFETLCHVLSTTSLFPSQEMSVSIENIIDKEISELGNDAAMKNSEKPSSDDMVNRRKTVQILEDEFKETRKSVKVGDILKSRFTMVQAEEDDRAEKRKSSAFRRMSNIRSSMAARRATMKGNNNAAFSTIDEEEKE